MKMITGSLLAGVLALACFGSAFGQSAATLTVKSGAGIPTPIAGQNDVSSNFHYRDVMEGLDSSGNPVAINVDPSTRDIVVLGLGSPFQANGSIGNAAFGISGTGLTDLNTIATNAPALNGDGGSPAHVTNWPTTQAVTGTFWQTTQPVSGTFWQSTQPVSIATAPALVASSAIIGKVSTVDSGGTDATDTVNHAIKVNVVAGGSSAAVAPYVATSTGYQQLTSVSTATGFTPPATTTFCYIQSETVSMRFRTDGTNPTATSGQLVAAGVPVLETANLSGVKFIPTTGSTTLDFDCYK